MLPVSVSPVLQRVLIGILVVWARLALFGVLVIELTHASGPQFLYYPALLGCVGLPTWFKRRRLALLLQQWRWPSLAKFLALGYGMVLLEEVLAALFNHLSEGFQLGLYLERVGQFWALNVLAFTGFVVGWCVLQRLVRFSLAEVFFLAGFAGLFFEHTWSFLFTNPLVFFILAPLNILTYGLIIAPASMSVHDPATQVLHPLIKYPLALVLLFACSLLPIAVLQTLRVHFPNAFPPHKFIS